MERWELARGNSVEEADLGIHIVEDKDTQRRSQTKVERGFRYERSQDSTLACFDFDRNPSLLKLCHDRRIEKGTLLFSIE